MMRAWELARDLFRSAEPVIVAAEEQSWESDAAAVMDKADFDLRMFWKNAVPGSGAPDCLAIAAIGAFENKGYRTGPFADIIAQGRAAAEAGDMETLHKAHMRLWVLLRAAVPDPDHPSQRTLRYSAWDELDRTTAWPADQAFDLQSDRYRDATRAGWLGQIVGAAAGTALEGYTMAQLDKRFDAFSHYVRPPNTYNDDVTFEIAFLEAFAAHGPALTGTDIAERWVGLIPFGWSAEAIALGNLHRGLMPPHSGRDHNPFDEWIGAQMRGAICGMVMPGRPREAARLAWIDGEISHTSNGILGSVFNAVLTARAYVETDLRTLLVTTASLFSTATEYGAVLAFALSSCRRSKDWREAWSLCDAEYMAYHWIHAYPNAAAEVVALWFGAHDFDTMIEIICRIGHDTDCNAAQTLGVYAIMNGAHSIPSRWIEPLGTDIVTLMRRPKRTSVADLTDRTIAAARTWARPL